MKDHITDQGDKILQVLDYAVHPNTGDTEILASIRGYQRLTKGMRLSDFARIVFGDGSDFSAMEDIWQDRFGQQELEIIRLRGEIRRLSKELSEAKQRRSTKSENATRIPRVKKPIPIFELTAAEWIIVEGIAPSDVLSKFRIKLAAAIVVVRTGCPWRAIGDNWTSYYNPYYNGVNAWRLQEWWTRVMEAIGK